MKINRTKAKKNHFFLKPIIISLTIHLCLLFIFYFIEFENKSETIDKFITLRLNSYQPPTIKTNRVNSYFNKLNNRHKNIVSKNKKLIKPKFIYFSKDFQNVIKELVAYTIRKKNTVDFTDSLTLNNHNLLSMKYIMLKRLKVAKSPFSIINEDMIKYLLSMYKLKHNSFGNDYPLSNSNSIGGIHIPINSIINLFR